MTFQIQIQYSKILQGSREGHTYTDAQKQHHDVHSGNSADYRWYPFPHHWVVQHPRTSYAVCIQLLLIFPDQLSFLLVQYI
jgi:hypothetical protein